METHYAFGFLLCILGGVSILVGVLLSTMEEVPERKMSESEEAGFMLGYLFVPIITMLAGLIRRWKFNKLGAWCVSCGMILVIGGIILL